MAGYIHIQSAGALRAYVGPECGASRGTSRDAQGTQELGCDFLLSTLFITGPRREEDPQFPCDWRHELNQLVLGCPRGWGRGHCVRNAHRYRAYGSRSADQRRHFASLALNRHLALRQTNPSPAQPPQDWCELQDETVP